MRSIQASSRHAAARDQRPRPASVAGRVSSPHRRHARIARATQVRRSEGLHHRGAAKVGLRHSQLPHRPEALAASDTGERGGACAPPLELRPRETSSPATPASNASQAGRPTSHRLPAGGFVSGVGGRAGSIGDGCVHRVTGADARAEAPRRVVDEWVPANSVWIRDRIGDQSVDFDVSPCHR